MGWVGQGLRESPEWDEFDGDSDLVIALTCRLVGERAQQRNNGACQH